MSEFDISFELFTLLLGLAMAEVLAGFVRVFKLRSRIRHGRGGGLEQVRIGWLVPLTAVVVICHQASFWLFMYQVQDHLPLNFLSLLAMFALIGWYYLISAALWPDEPEAWPDFDAYYMAHRRFVWLGVIGIALLAELGRTVYGVEPAVTASPALVEWVENADMIGTFALLAMPFVRSARWALALLAVLVAHFAVLAAASPLVPM